ncbi:MAG: carboxypeptidase-like regulatory domain-containing protein [Bacteroidales bacterium]|nr:carboxypeptidase-like regulatory domain-containing protein [Bacteroidales bacterium]
MKSKILFIAILHVFIFAPWNLTSQTIITGYSDVFVIGTPTESHPVFIAYSPVFEINTMGQSFAGYSGLFALNTIGGYIHGIITDSQTGLPVPNAVVKTLNYTSLPSDNEGMYNLHVPYGYGYGLAILAENYETQYYIPVNVPEDEPVVELNYQMVYTPIDIELTTLDPNPNPAISEVQQGGVLHRHYKVFNNYNGNPVIVPVHVTGNGFSSYFISKDDGVVDIAIESSQVGNGQPGSQEVFSIVSVGNEQLTDPIQFTCEVEESLYEKYWDNYNYAKIGGNFLGLDLSAEMERGAVTSVVTSSGFPNDPINLDVSRQGRAGLGVGFKVKSPGAKGSLGPIQGGIGAEAGLGAKFMGLTVDNYQFPYESTTDWEAIAKYILIGDGNYKSIDNAMIRILSLFEDEFTSQSTLSDAFISDGVGIDVSYDASAEAFAGVEVTQNAKIGAGANIGTEAHVTFEAYNHYFENEFEFNFGVSGKFATEAGAGLKMDLDNNGKDDLNAMLTVWDKNSSRGLQFSTFLDSDDPGILKRFELKFLKRNYLSKYEEEIVFSIDGQEALNAISTLTNEIQQIRNSHFNSTNITVKNNTFKLILDEVFDAIYDIQANSSGDANISYQKELTKISSIGSFELSLDLSITALALEVGGGVGFEKGKKMIVESGKWAYGKKYMNQEYTSEIPEIPISYQQVLQEIIDDVPWWLRWLIATIDVLVPGKDDITFYVGDNGSYIIFPDNAFPVGFDSIHCSSWSWYGNAPSKTIDAIDQDKKFIYIENKKDAEDAFGMIYGIGGFYQFEPYATLLPDTAWMTIVYDEAEVDSLDESSLGMYWEDKTNHVWNYLGGALDTTNNTVTAPITQLSLFTLAPAMPFGAFGLNAVPDSIYADSVSISVVTSDTIFNNNLKPVSDGEKFTVATNYGKVISPDADSIIQGIQVLATNHKIQFEVKSCHIGGTAIASAYSVNGSANGDTQIQFYDTIPPAAPMIIDVVGGNSLADVSWHSNSESDLSGYKIYFDTDTLMPLDGIHTVYGEPSPINVGSGTTKSVYGLFNDSTYYFAMSAIDVSGNESQLSEFVSASVLANSLTLKVFLEGSFNGIDLMRTDLNDSALIPLSQPFNAVPWYYSGAESVTAIPNMEIVDWVLVELRETLGDSSTATSDKVIFRQAAFILKDGTIVGRDGVSPLILNVDIIENLFAVIWHRNHLGVMSANSLIESGGIYSYDFTTSETQTYGGINSVKELAPGVWGMIAADGNADGLIDGLDKTNVWAPQSGESGYKTGDYNMDAEVDNKDKNDVWVPNIGKGSQLPE